MLPSDPGYQSQAPVSVQAMPIYQQMLQANTDPYAAHSRNHEICRMLEAASAANQRSTLS